VHTKRRRSAELVLTERSSPASSGAPSARSAAGVMLQGLKLRLTATFESDSSQSSCNRLVPGGFNLGWIGPTCTAPSDPTSVYS